MAEHTSKTRGFIPASPRAIAMRNEFNMLSLRGRKARLEALYADPASDPASYARKGARGRAVYARGPV